jgi:hypothetical protein
MSNYEKIIAKVSQRTGFSKSTVRSILHRIFKEIGFILITSKSPILIRRFIKIVMAAVVLKKLDRDIKSYETRNK